MKRGLFAFFSGALFAIGLGISGMTQPAKVIGFLDIAGRWDASLAFVMVGAISVNLVALRLFLRNRRASLCGEPFRLPTRRDIDGRLVTGAALFGIGWGLGGYCPGPGLTSLATTSMGPLVFVLAMAAGMVLQAAIFDRASKAEAQGSTTSARA